MKYLYLAVLLTAFSISACSPASEPPADSPPSSEAQPAASHGSGKTAGYGSLTATLPDGWVDQPLASQMRLGNYTMPKQGGDTEDAEMVVSFFGNSPGISDVQANLQRWAGQFIQPDGSSSQDKLETSEMTVSGMNVTVAKLTGTFMRSKTPGMMMGPKVEAPAYRLLAAIVESKDGPYFFKITGPGNTVEHWEHSFITYIRSIH